MSICSFVRDVLNPICTCKSGKRWNQCCGRHSEVSPGVMERVKQALAKPTTMKLRQAKRKIA